MRERTTITFAPKNKEVTLAGIVVYVEHGMGFAVQFDPLTPSQVEVLKDILGDMNL